MKSVLGTNSQCEIPLLKHNNLEYSNSLSISDIFNLYFNNIASEIERSIPVVGVDPTILVPKNNFSVFLRPITIDECLGIISKLKNSKPDLHNLPVYLLKIFSEMVSPILCDIFNLCLTSGVFPDELKFSTITPVHKKGARDDLNNYRPISVISTISKILEKCIRVRLGNFMEKHNLINPMKFGLLENKSTEEAALKFVDIVQESLEKKVFALSIFIDFTKAFDTISHVILLKKLELYGIRGIALKLIASYLSKRKHRTKVNSWFSSYKTIEIGLPQGSILSPLLFLFYINDLFFISTNFHKIFFADDTTFILIIIIYLHL